MKVSYFDELYELQGKSTAHVFKVDACMYKLSTDKYALTYDCVSNSLLKVTFKLQQQKDGICLTIQTLF